MKIRNGFVSNSSSSSFVLMADKEVFNEVMKDMHPYVKHLVGTEGNVEMFNGKEVIIKMRYESNEDWDWHLDDYYGDVINSKGEVICTLIKGVENEENDNNLYDAMTTEDAYDYVCDKINEHTSESAIFDSESC